MIAAEEKEAYVTDIQISRAELEREREREREIGAARLRPCLRPYAAADTTTHTMPFPGTDAGEGEEGAGGRGRRLNFISWRRPRKPLAG